jgi:protein dithiol oxidoreductase (disulfide-forming)
MQNRLALLVGIGLLLAACGKQESTTEAPARPAAAALKAAAPAPPPAADQHLTAPAQGESSKITITNEDGTETVEDTAADSAKHNAILAAVAATVAATTSTAMAATPPAPTIWQEGVNYTRIVPAQPTSVPAGQVEVLEFFWYACPHCYAIDPLVESWIKSKPAYISFSRVHVMWSDAHRSLARLYYTLDTLGKLKELHSEVFKEIHVNGNPLVAADPSNVAETERIQTVFVKKFGVSEDAFKKAYHSFAVETAMQRADQLVQRYRVDGVPTFVINGKYLADVRSAQAPGNSGGPERLMTLVGDLADQEHKH